MFAAGLICAALAASCGDLAAVGDEGQPCSKKSVCREGLVCAAANHTCVNPGAVPAEDAGPGADGGLPADAGADVALSDAFGDASDLPDTSDASLPDAGADAGADAASDASADASDTSDLSDTSDASLPDGGSDGGGEDGATEDAGCVPQCAGKCGGDDGCGAFCPNNCVAPQTCGGGGTPNVCGCTPNCAGIQCGDDGCGGSCGDSCNPGLACAGGSCVHCGDYGEPCCTSDACNSPALCNDGTCVSDTCVGKGDFTLCKLVQGTPDRSYDICVNETCVSPGCGDATCNTPGPHFPLPDTGQRKCYDNTAEMTCTTFPCNVDGTPDFCGQDWQYGWDTTHQSTERFTRTEPVAGEPLVHDNVTGLEWQGCPAGLKGTDCTVDAIVTKNWLDALAYCEGLTWAGFDDWRLPDTFEFVTILDYGSVNPSVYAPAFPQTPDGPFRSASSISYDTRYSWEVEFDSGQLESQVHFKTEPLNVRCVRGVPATSQNRFVRSEPVVGQAIVADAVSGLTWQGCVAGLDGSGCTNGVDATFAWRDALRFCEALDWGNADDWRLPNILELYSLVDNRRSGPATDNLAFPSTPDKVFWSSTAYSGGSHAKWDVQFATGAVGMAGEPNTRAVRCVR
jgi:hypothetical protein